MNSSKMDQNDILKVDQRDIFARDLSISHILREPQITIYWKWINLTYFSVIWEISTFQSGSKYYKWRTTHANIISVIKITTLIRILHFIFILILIMISSVEESVESHSFNFMEAGFLMSTRKSKKLILIFLQRVWVMMMSQLNQIFLHFALLYR